jgi:hypothetical protein
VDVGEEESSPAATATVRLACRFSPWRVTGFVAKGGRGLGGAFALAVVVLDVLEGAPLRADQGERLWEGALGRLVRFHHPRATRSVRT